MNDLNLWDALAVVADLAEQTGYPGISKQLNALAHFCDETPQPTNIPRYVTAKSTFHGDIIHVPGGGTVTVDSSYTDWVAGDQTQVITLTNSTIIRLPNDWLLLVEPSEHIRDVVLEKALSDALVLDEGLNDNAYNEEDIGSDWP